MMLGENNKVTVVTVCYNAATVIEETILSVLSQDYQSMEYIVIDGGSADGTVDIIKKYSDRIAYWVSEPDGGIYYAMNKAVEHATGDYVNFMNAGDTFFDSNVLKDIFYRKLYTEDVIYGSNLCRYSGGYKSHHPAGFEVLDKAMPFCHQSSFTRTDVLRAYPFDTDYRRVADYVFFRRLYDRGVSFRRVDKYICVYDEYGISSNITLDYYFELCRAFGWKASMKEYLKYCMFNRMKSLRYCRLRFLISSYQKPGKYQLHPKGFKQM